MAELIRNAPSPATQRYRVFCVACKCYFSFNGDEIERDIAGANAFCSTPCPGCAHRVRWTETQTSPIPLDEPPLPVITGSDK